MSAAAGPSANRRSRRKALARRVACHFLILALLNTSICAKPAVIPDTPSPTASDEGVPQEGLNHSRSLESDTHVLPLSPSRHAHNRPSSAVTEGDHIYFSSSYASLPEKTHHRHHHSKATKTHASKHRSKQTAPPPDAFPYLYDIGLRHRLPFKSGMPQTGHSWDEAGLRPNIDPRMPSAFRPERQRLSIADTDHAGSNDGRDGAAHPFRTPVAASPGTHDDIASASGGNGKLHYPAKAPGWTLKSEDPTRETSDDAEAAATADEWSLHADAASPADEPLAQALVGAPADPQSAGPALLRWSSRVLTSGKQVWRWIKSNAKDKDGIALTMLKPKVHRPVVASLPLIPNDSKRDFVCFLLGTLLFLAFIATAWNSRVTPEEYFRAKKAKDNARRSPHLSYTHLDEPVEEEVHLLQLRGSGDSSSYPRNTAGRRRPRPAHRRDTHSLSSVEVASDTESEVDHPLYRQHQQQNLASLDHDNEQSGTWFFQRWFGGSKNRKHARGKRRRSSGNDPRIPTASGSRATPRYSESSRSTTPRPGSSILASGADEETAETRNWNLPMSSHLGRHGVSSTSNAPVSGGGPAAALFSNVVGSETASALLAKTPFRSLTPQPQTQRQRERERSRERHLAAEREVMAGQSNRHGEDYDRLESVESGNAYGGLSPPRAEADNPYWSPASWNAAPPRASSANSHRLNSRQTPLTELREGEQEALTKQFHGQNSLGSVSLSMARSVSANSHSENPRAQARDRSESNRSWKGKEREMWT